MKFWQVFEARRPSVDQKVFGQSVPNWKNDREAAESGQKLIFQSETGSYAGLYINFAGTLVADVDNSWDFHSANPAQCEDKLRDQGIIKYAGYDDTH